jgi:hypothetical protein
MQIQVSGELILATEIETEKHERRAPVVGVPALRGCGGGYEI